MTLPPPTRDELERLGADVVAELEHAARGTLEALREKGQRHADDVRQALQILGRLVARQVAGEDVEADLAFVRAALKGYEAVAAMVVARAADQLAAEGLKVVGVYAAKAGEILAKFARGLALGAIAL